MGILVPYFATEYPIVREIRFDRKRRQIECLKWSVPPGEQPRLEARDWLDEVLVVIHQLDHRGGADPLLRLDLTQLDACGLGDGFWRFQVEYRHPFILGGSGADGQIVQEDLQHRAKLFFDPDEDFFVVCSEAFYLARGTSFEEGWGDDCEAEL